MFDIVKASYSFFVYDAVSISAIGENPQKSHEGQYRNIESQEMKDRFFEFVNEYFKKITRHTYYLTYLRPA